jgi:hypothetical protein
MWKHSRKDDWQNYALLGWPIEFERLDRYLFSCVTAISCDGKYLRLLVCYPTLIRSAPAVDDLTI